MTVDYEKSKVIQYEIELFKTKPTPINSILWETILVPFAESQGYITQEDSNIVMASYQAYFNCLSSQGKLISSVSIGDISTTYAGNGNNKSQTCISNIYIILESLNLDVDFGENNYNSMFAAVTGDCNRG